MRKVLKVSGGGLVDLREYMSVRRAYNAVRQALPSDSRITFEEFAILCRLAAVGEPVKTSAIAEYQQALRPTMTHRTNHLVTAGLIERGEGDVDRRNVVCKITEKGNEFVQSLSAQTREQIPAGQPLSRTSPERIMRYVDAMGSVFMKAGDLVLLSLLLNEDGDNTITSLVDSLALLQPTVSMSVNALDSEGLVSRARQGSRTVGISLTPAGKEAALELARRVSEIVVHRKPRAKAPKK